MNQLTTNPTTSTSQPVSPPQGSGQRIAFIQSSWHRDIVDQCRFAFMKEIAAKGFSEWQVDVFDVPGAFEIPLQAKLLAKTGRYAAIVAAGFVVDGGIYRHEFVAQAVLQGIVNVSTETGVPVLSAVLTPQHFHEHQAHEDFFKQHMFLKGKELAEACAAIVKSVASVEQLTPA